MKKARKELQPGERFFVRIDLHNNKWHVTVRTAGLELFSGSIPGILDPDPKGWGYAGKI